MVEEVITIDGPTASGKGTVAQRLASILGFHYLDSGALYRLIALASQQKGLDPNNAEALAKLAADVDIQFSEGRVWLNGESVAQQIRVEEIGNLASIIATHTVLRQALIARQRSFCRSPGLVADGRDMGTVIFPHAQLKVFLVASVEVRAQRRYKQLIEKGFSASIADLLRDLRERDARDYARLAAPLKAAKDAHVLDSSLLSAEQVIEQVLAWRMQIR